MKFWCTECMEERRGEWMTRRPLGPFCPPSKIFGCEVCGSALVEAGECIYCGEPCDPEAYPLLCPGCKYDLEEAINKTVQNLCDPEGGEIGTDTKINALYALATEADAMREDLERQVINANKRKAPED